MKTYKVCQTNWRKWTLTATTASFLLYALIIFLLYFLLFTEFEETDNENKMSLLPLHESVSLGEEKHSISTNDSGEFSDEEMQLENLSTFGDVTEEEEMKKHEVAQSDSG